MNPEPETSEVPAIEPCEHMKDYVSALADDSLRGPMRLYTKFHLTHCRKCKASYKALRVLRQRLDRLRGTLAEKQKSVLPAERQARIEKALDAVDAGQGG